MRKTFSTTCLRKGSWKNREGIKLKAANEEPEDVMVKVLQIFVPQGSQDNDFCLQNGRREGGFMLCLWRWYLSPSQGLEAERSGSVGREGGFSVCRAYRHTSAALGAGRI